MNVNRGVIADVLKEVAGDDIDTFVIEDLPTNKRFKLVALLGERFSFEALCDKSFLKIRNSEQLIDYIEEKLTKEIICGR